MAGAVASVTWTGPDQSAAPDSYGVTHLHDVTARVRLDCIINAYCNQFWSELTVEKGKRTAGKVSRMITVE